MMKKIQTGKAEISLLALLAIWSVSAITSLPGLAVSPVLGKLGNVFPHATDLEIQMLTSLPSMLVIPFLFLSGKLSASKGKVEILTVGLLIFLLSGIAYFFANSMFLLILISSILGIGAGIVIPLSTGLIAEYFDGRYRTQQLGISSAINNLTLVIATYLTGWLAGINWHTPFAVYLLPIISIVLCRFLPKKQPQKQDIMSNIPLEKKTHRIDKRKLLRLMLFYFFITYCVLAVLFNLPFLMNNYKMNSESSGTIISLFFLAVTLPGFFINRILDKMDSSVNWICMSLIAVGLFLIFLSHHILLFGLGSVLAGLGYGVMQPLIYDKTAKIASETMVVMALAAVMSMNYFSILISPFIMQLFELIFHDSHPNFSFLINGILALIFVVIAYKNHKGFVLGK